MNVNLLRLPALLVAVSPALWAAAPDDYLIFVRQHQQGSGVIWDMPVPLRGESRSPLAIDDHGSLFQLWAIHRASATDTRLDQKLVGAYLPMASITITTEDPHPGIPRTRADRPFEVAIELSGLLSGPDLPLASRMVLLDHHAADYPESRRLSAEDACAGEPLNSAYLPENGTTNMAFSATSLSGPDPTKVSGEEHFLIHALFDGEIPQVQIASAHVRIWPVAAGKISGITAGETIRSAAPRLTVELEDLYPRSDTWLRLYRGALGAGTKDTATLPGSMLILDQDEPEDRVLLVDDWDAALEDDGQYTIELVTRTPFGIDRLDHVSFHVKRTLKIHGMLADLK